MENVHGHVFECLDHIQSARSADGDGRSPCFWRAGREIPCSETTHRKAGEVDAVGIDRILLRGLEDECENCLIVMGQARRCQT